MEKQSFLRDAHTSTLNKKTEALTKKLTNLVSSTKILK
jgi:hypothetical protein